MSLIEEEVFDIEYQEGLIRRENSYHYGNEVQVNQETEVTYGVDM